MPLFHFSEESHIISFVPRAAAVPSQREPGMEWLNGPIVWAIDEWHQPMYLFPRDCPRVLVWPVAGTTAEDRRVHWTTSGCRMLAYIEWGWLERLRATTVRRYALPAAGFEDLHDSGMWVARSTVVPTEVRAITPLTPALEEAGVELRLVPSLKPLKPLWDTSLHVSGIRLRNMREELPA